MPRGRPRIIKSWDGRREDHPFTRFPESDNNASSLILGSFPPNRFTIYPERQTMCDIRFFYGSKDNSFWELFIAAKGLQLRWPDDFEELKEWLTDNNWVISDIVRVTSRKRDSARDSDLSPVEWNRDIIKDILQNNPIQSIYYTSNWVKKNFDKSIKSHLDVTEINYREIVLISPSRSGLISTKWCRGNFSKKTGENLEDYRMRYYQHYLQ